LSCHIFITLYCHAAIFATLPLSLRHYDTFDYADDAFHADAAAIFILIHIERFAIFAMPFSMLMPLMPARYADAAIAAMMPMMLLKAATVFAIRPLMPPFELALSPHTLSPYFRRPPMLTLLLFAERHDYFAISLLFAMMLTPFRRHYAIIIADTLRLRHYAFATLLIRC
jgi:hypothetical protein